MGHGIAAAGLEFCPPAPRLRDGRVLEVEGIRTCRTACCKGRPRLRGDRDAEKQRDRLRDRVLCRYHRLCVDLAHLVDGGARRVRCFRDDPRFRLSRARGSGDTGKPDCGDRSRSSRGGRVMNVAIAVHDVRAEEVTGAAEAGPAPKRTVVAYGFWIFLLSDIVMFSALFAGYAVLVRATAGGPSGPQLFNQVTVAIETGCLLASSYTCGLMSLAIGSRRPLATYLGAAITFVLGAAFLALVGCHGLHVGIGLIWLVVMMAQVAIKGFAATVERRLLCFSLFWHALDIIWVGLFTVVYLMGVSP